MKWMEQNIDAYRIIAEILTNFRNLFTETLKTIHGEQWTKRGIPPKTYDNLVAQREAEQAIDWFDSEYRELMVYATFDDFLEILQADDTIFPAVTALAPSQPLLHTRFLELEVMRKKLGRARPIGEAELSFLGSFHMRFQKSLTAALENGDELSSSENPSSESPADEQEDLHDDPTANEDPGKDPDHENVTMAVDLPTDDVAVAETQADPAAIEPDDRGSESDQTEDETDGDSDDQTRSKRPPIAEVPVNIKTAIEQEDTPFILKKLYAEITTIAEGMWSSSHSITPNVWEAVKISSWYQSHFSRIGLKPVSDFYKIITSFYERVERDEEKEELQNFLKETNFAHVLLALRDMFQRLQIH